jgi:valyl-tRNA synthetase
VLVTGYEILYLWVARMIMSGLYLAGDIPFRQVVITGLVRDKHGRPMHKSSGNVIDPLDLIAKYGADALRFGLARLATGGQDIPLSEEGIEAARRFANKIWNAARLVLSAREGREGPLELPDRTRLTLPDRWIISRHQECLSEVDQAFEEYRFADASQALYRFFWSEFCDWALEAAKPRLYEGSSEERQDTSDVLSWVLERSLRLLHPTMPFVTEEVWQRFGAGDSIMVAPWPEGHPDHHDERAEVDFGYAMSVVTTVRRFRKAHGLKDSTPLPVQVFTPDSVRREVLKALRPEIERMAGVSALEVIEERADREGFAHLSAGEAGDVLIPMAGLFDTEVEKTRLSKRMADIDRSVAQSEAKLQNQSFVMQAPPDVVEKERRKLALLKKELAELADQRGELG